MFLLENIICAIFRGFMFWDISNRILRGKYSKTSSLLVFLAVSTLGNLPLFAAGPETLPFATLGYYALFLLCMVFLFRDKLATKLIYGILVFSGVGVGQVILMLFFSVLPDSFQKTINEFPNISSVFTLEFLGFLVYSLFTFGVVYLIIRVLAAMFRLIKLRRKMPRQAWFMLAPISQIMMTFAFTLPSVANSAVAQKMDASTRISLIIAVLICGVSDVFLFYAMREMDKKAMLESRLQQMEQIQLSDFQQYRLMDELYRKERMFRHDINNKLTASLSMLEYGNLHECSTLLREISEQIGSYKRQEYCENTLLNTVLSNKLGYAEELGIQVKTTIQVGELKLSPSDLCSVFSNILDNAIEACQKIPAENKPFLSLSASTLHGYLVVRCENSALSGLQADSSNHSASRGDSHAHGWGLEILRQIAQKYDGNLHVEFSDGVFRLEEILRKG